jgi:hypothetical protein
MDVNAASELVFLKKRKAAAAHPPGGDEGTLFALHKIWP